MCCDRFLSFTDRCVARDLIKSSHGLRKAFSPSHNMLKRMQHETKQSVLPVFQKRRAAASQRARALCSEKPTGVFSPEGTLGDLCKYPSQQGCQAQGPARGTNMTYRLAHGSAGTDPWTACAPKGLCLSLFSFDLALAHAHAHSHSPRPLRTSPPSLSAKHRARCT